MCLTCQRQRSMRVASRVAEALKGKGRIRMVTLTLRDDGQPLRLRVLRIQAAFRLLRRSRVWKGSVSGAVTVLEVTRGREGGHWHVHLHCLCTGGYMAHAQLRTEWQRVTKDSFVVEIHEIRDVVQASRYVAKYVAKGSEVHTWTAKEITEYALAMKGIRLVSTSGILHNAHADHSEDNDMKASATPVATVSELQDMAEMGSEPAALALAYLRHLGPLYAAIVRLTEPVRRAMVYVHAEEATVDRAVALAEEAASAYRTTEGTSREASVLCMPRPTESEQPLLLPVVLA